jgi:hypothetical protein
MLIEHHIKCPFGRRPLPLGRQEMMFSVATLRSLLRKHACRPQDNRELVRVADSHRPATDEEFFALRGSRRTGRVRSSPTPTSYINSERMPEQISGYDMTATMEHVSIFPESGAFCRVKALRRPLLKPVPSILAVSTLT